MTAGNADNRTVPGFSGSDYGTDHTLGAFAPAGRSAACSDGTNPVTERLGVPKIAQQRLKRVVSI